MTVTPLNPTTSKDLPHVVKQLLNTSLRHWAIKRINAILAKLELSREKQTLTPYWLAVAKPALRDGYLMGFDSGFKIGFDTAIKLHSQPSQTDKAAEGGALPEQLELPL